MIKVEHLRRAERIILDRRSAVKPRVEGGESSGSVSARHGHKVISIAVKLLRQCCISAK